MSWIYPPNAQHAWSLDEIKQGNLVTTYSLNDMINNNRERAVYFGRIADDPSLVDIVTAHESCSRRHARIAFDRNGTPWLRDLGSGNGTFVNERRLPPEACGKEESIDGKQKGSRGVVLYPGDALRFGASTRLFILEGPEEYERDAIELKRRMKLSVAADVPDIATHSDVTTTAKEKEFTVNNDVGCSWGMEDDHSDVVIDQEQSARVDAASLPSIDSFFSSQQYKISDPLYKLHSQYNTKMHKLQSIQLESQRILQKENMGVELTDGQRGQLAKNGERITTLEKVVANLTNRIEDGMYKTIHGKDRGRESVAKKDQYNADDDAGDDDFFDRTVNKQQSDGDEAESEMSLIQKWKSLLDTHTKQELVVIRAQGHCERIQKQINEITTDDEDSFFLQNDLALANDNLCKATKCIESTAKELDSVEYLLKIVNAKLNWDRREGLIGTNITKIVDTSMDVFDDQETTQQIGFDDMEDDSRIMPPPPRLSPEKVDPVYPQDKVKSMMPPPIKVDTEPLSKKQRVIGPMRPPPQPDNDQSISNCATEPQRKKIQLGPVKGTLAVLQRASSQPKTANYSDSTKSTINGHDANTPQLVISDPFETKKDEWVCPSGQDGSGRTALHDKFKGRY